MKETYALKTLKITQTKFADAGNLKLKTNWMTQQGTSHLWEENSKTSSSI